MPKAKRKLKEMRTLLPLMKEDRFFKERKMDEDLILRICQIANYKFVQEGQFVFEQDQEADSLYLILSGEVAVRIRNKNIIELMRDVDRK